MNDQQTSESVCGEAADPMDVFYVEWGLETAKSSLVYLSETLRLMATLSILLLGGSVFFLQDRIIPTLFQGIIVVFFLSGLICSFIGMLPVSQEKLCPFVAEEIRGFKEKIFWRKKAWLVAAAVCMSLGFLVSFFSLIILAPIFAK